MADMIGVSIVLVLFATAFPSYLAVVWRVWPEAVDRARVRLTRTPGRSLALEIALTLVASLPIAVLLALPNGVAQFLGYTGIVLALAGAGVGAAGFATHIGRGAGLRGFLVGATLTELAMAFPVIGWFLVAPLLLLVSVGAGAFAALRWVPRERPIDVVPAPALVAETH